MTVNATLDEARPLVRSQTTAEAFLMGKDVKVEVNVRGRLLPKKKKVEE